ncbi:hypothetical protein HFN63_34285 [Rhizobium leguminosarum]|uniref:hypothetical protein n=1 Tax=Rhizobium leguminosarum TaxID=384 RepID=UPI001C979609|nr:hypothetical protein [Rhizobium leguminosarum]MBY5775065.1 hypothetical protein [Rhizobium leguminosarum]
MESAPYNLAAIGYRPDLVRLNLEENRITSGGEARFVFQAISQCIFQAQTLIFEYTLRAANVTEVKEWTKDYDALRKLPFGPTFNDELLKITKKFTDRNVKYPVPNNVTLGQLRTNELFRPGTFQWELREFHISQRGQLEPSTVQMNPDLMFNTPPEDQTLRDYLNSSEFNGSFPHTTIPWTFAGKPFLLAARSLPLHSSTLNFCLAGVFSPSLKTKLTLGFAIFQIPRNGIVLWHRHVTDAMEATPRARRFSLAKRHSWSPMAFSSQVSRT